MRFCRQSAFVAAMLVLASVTTASAQTLVWSDEFDGPAIDTSTWTFNCGGSGFGNGELQYYTARPENARIEDGSLIIEARRENYLGDRAFTSSRLVTNGRFSFKYGTVEARIKLPDVNYGMWPALWIMGTNFGAVNWPNCGEVDIMEFGRKDGFLAGLVNQRVSAAGHYELNDAHVYTTDFIDRPAPMYQDYHLFKLEWTPDHLQVSVDNLPYWFLDISDPVGDDTEEFHKPMFLLTNVAVGGWNFIEITDPNAISAPFPGRMYIDYIRLYDNGDTELYDASDVQETGNFGVLTENTPVNNAIQYGSDAELYIWNNLTESTGTAFEGAEAWHFHAAAGAWWGMGVLSTQFDRNMKNYSDGAMHFHMKTSAAAPFKVGIKSTTAGESWVKFDADNSWGLVRDGNWHEVIIPLNNFLNCDFNTVSQIFMIASDPSGANFDFSIDNIYWTPSVDRPTPENGNFGVFTEDPAHKTAGEYLLGQDGNFFIWEHTLNDRPQNPYEGSACLSFQSAPGLNWFGAAFTPTIKYNLSAFRFPESKLHFAMKTNSTVNFRIGMRSGNVDDIGQKWINFNNGSDPYGFVRDGNWHVVEIPMADFMDAVNLTEVSMLFETLGVSGPISNIELDDICFLNGGTALAANAGYPEADAGNDLVIILPNSSAVIDGSSSHDDGTIASFAWTQVSGPSTATLNGANTAILTASDLIEGVYKFRLTVTDDEGLTDIDDVFVTVASPLPTANAGADQSIVLPGQSSVTLTGSGTDFDGTIIAYQWAQVGGPSPATLTDADTATATASNLQVGTYIFELTVTDNDLNTATDEAIVDVTYPPQNIALNKPTTASSTGSGDPVRNGGFEGGSGAMADSWTMIAYPAGSSTASSIRSSTNPRTGSWHATLSVAGAANGGPAAVCQQDTGSLTIVPGNTYSFKSYARRIGTVGPGVVVQMNLQWLSSVGGVVGGSGYIDIGGQLTESYAQYGFTNLVAPNGADKALVVLRLAGGAFSGSAATVAFDDVTMTASNAVQPTSDRAVDGDDQTAWSSQPGDPQWLAVDLNGAFDISQFVIKWGEAASLVYDIDVSDDGSQWTTVYSSNSSVGGVETININTTASHLRLYSHTGLGSDGCSIKEFEAYGYPASTPSVPGDLNQSGAVELTDIPHFVDALLGNPPANAGIAQARADMNSDSLWDGADIQLFVDALIAP